MRSPIRDRAVEHGPERRVGADLGVEGIDQPADLVLGMGAAVVLT